MHLNAQARRLAALACSWLALAPAAAHPLDPLNADEIIGAAQVLLAGGAAQPGAIFQSVELREPPKAAVLGVRQRAAAAPGHGVLPPEPAELQEHREPERRHVHAAGAHPHQRRPARPDDHRGVGLQLRVRRPGLPGRAGAPRHPHAGAAGQGVRDAAHRRLLRPAGREQAHRQGADVLHRRRGHQPVRQADRGHAGDHRSRCPQGAARHRHRCRAHPGRDARVRRSQRGRAGRPAPGAQADPHLAAGGAELQSRGPVRRVAEVALPPAFRPPHRAGGVAGHLCRAAGDVPGHAVGDLRALPGRRSELVLPHLHGRRRVRLRAAGLAAEAGAGRAGKRRAAGRPGVGRHPRPERARGAAAAGQCGGGVRAPHRQPGVAPLRAVLGRRLRGPRRGGTGGAQHRAGGQLRLPARLGVHAERRDPR